LNRGPHFIVHLLMTLQTNSFLFFFFHCSGAPRDLHSFPTRRSSDLQTPFADRIRHEVGIATMAVGNISSYQDVNTILAAGRENRDRKSTRLNSSHVKNSYAVFCLKKKKKPSNVIISYSAIPTNLLSP